jgi:hypothetical protein
VEREKVKACIETRLFCKLFLEKIESYHLSKSPLFFSVICHRQGDQIGQNFTIWAIFYCVGQFFSRKIAQ